MRALLVIVATLALTSPLLGCSLSLAQAGPQCTIVSSSIGRGLSTVTCTPKEKTIIVPPPSSSEEVINPNFVWLDRDPNVDTPPIHMDEEMYQVMLNNVCLERGCTIIETSATGIEVKGGPPDKNVVTGFFDSLFSMATWVATRYFGAGF